MGSATSKVMRDDDEGGDQHAEAGDAAIRTAGGGADDEQRGRGKRQCHGHLHRAAPVAVLTVLLTAPVGRPDIEGHRYPAHSRGREMRQILTLS